MAIGQKPPLETIRESCCATDPMSSDSSADLRGVAWNPSTRASILVSPSAGTLLSSSCLRSTKRNVRIERLKFTNCSLISSFLIGDPNSILVRHRKFLKQLELKKGIEREEAMLNDAHNSQKVQNFKDQAARQRDKIKDLKNDELRKQNEEMVEQF